MDSRPFFETIHLPEPMGTYFTVTNSGTVLAFGGSAHPSRMPGGIDHGYPRLHSRARSIDQGRTWTLEEKKWWEPETRGHSASVVDRTTGEIFLFNGGAWPIDDDKGEPVSESWMIINYRKGLEMGAQMFMERSRDDGRTWERVDLTDRCLTYPGAGLAWFIGGGIQLQHGTHAGRLVVPGRYFGKDVQELDPEKHNILHQHESLGPIYDDGDGQMTECLNDESHNTVIYSDDHGETWQWGGSSQGFSGEACIVELSDGSVYMSNRNHDPKSMGHRSWCISRDGGTTFTDFGVDETLIESRCHASLVRYVDPSGSKPVRILFSNPPVHEGIHQSPSRGCGKKCRINQTVRVSYDDCKTWRLSRRVHEEAAYSSLVVLEDGTILCGFKRIVNRFNMAWLEQGMAPR